MTRCPRCAGRVFIDVYEENQPYCLSCGWRDMGPPWGRAGLPIPPPLAEESTSPTTLPAPKATRRRYNHEQIVTALEMVKTKGLRPTARELGIPTKTLHVWVQAAQIALPKVRQEKRHVLSVSVRGAIRHTKATKTPAAPADQVATCPPHHWVWGFALGAEGTAIGGAWGCAKCGARKQ